MKKILTSCILLALMLFTSCKQTNLQQIVKDSQMKPQLITTNGSINEITSACIPSVVAISANSFNSQSVGSGVCVADNGLIVTNYHVVNDANSIYLYLANGKTTSAQILWKDKALDLALIKSKISIPWLEIAPYGSYSIGEEVIAIGTPIDLNFKHSVTKGVISAINRTVQVDNENGYSQMTHLLQHDASINPGNSGGPLINSNGQIIGINTIKVEDAEGMGFAIVCDTILPVIKNFNKQGYHSNGYLGIFGYDASLETFGSKDYGLKIVSISQNSPLNNYNIFKGDIITKINEKDINDYLTLKKELYKINIGEEVKLNILQNGKSRLVKVRLIKNEFE